MHGSTTAPSLAHLSTLADPTRSRLLFVLERQELTVGELCAVLQLPQSTISRHLRVLGDDGWVASRADGTSRYYRKTEPEAGRAERLWEVVREELALGEGAADDLARLGATVAARRRRSAEYFSGVAERWDEERAELFGTDLDQQLLLSLLHPDWVVGDLGCGSGRLSALLAPRVARVIAVDASPDMLAMARDRLQHQPNIEIHQSDLEHLPIADHTLDLAVCSLVLAYTAEPGEVLSAVYRALKPGGRLTILDLAAHADTELRHAMGQVWSGFTPAQLNGWLTAVGFAGVRTQALSADPRAKAPALQLTTAAKPR